jgi:hypothetical protein
MIVVCINDKDRPNEIPTSKWIEKGKEYTVIKADYMNMQNKILGYQLQEIDLSGCFPYLYFAASRFAIKEDQPEKELEKEVEFEEELELA